MDTTQTAQTTHARPITLSRRKAIVGGAGLAVGAATAALGMNGAAASTTVAATEATLREYLDVLLANGDFGRYFADDIVVTLVDVDQEIAGRDAAVQAIADLHQVNFTAKPEFGPLVVGDGTAALEAVFVGTHTGEFAGIAATDREVRVPYGVFYELVGGEITALRLYGLASGLILQLTAEAATS